MTAQELTTAALLRKPRDADEVRFIEAHTGTVHIPAISEQIDDESSERMTAESFADAVLGRSRMICGRSLAVDWAEYGIARMARPAGDFQDEQLCAACIRVMGDQSVLVFERLNEDDRARSRLFGDDQ